MFLGITEKVLPKASVIVRQEATCEADRQDDLRSK